MITTLGKNVVKARVDKGMKQKDLVETTGLSQRYVSAIEHDNVDPSVSVVLRLGEALGVSGSDLLTGVVYKEKE